MPGREGIVGALGGTGKPRKSFVTTQSVKPIAAPGDQFVRICLVTDIPDDPVLWRIENIVKSDGQFHRPETGSQVATGDSDHIHDDLTNFFSQLIEFSTGKLFNVCWKIDAIE